MARKAKAEPVALFWTFDPSTDSIGEAISSHDKGRPFALTMADVSREVRNYFVNDAKDGDDGTIYVYALQRVAVLDVQVKRSVGMRELPLDHMPGQKGDE